ncbi:MAG: DUF429 domain-containing protein [Alicyclobacillus sp.]|nr:DUF429 domain-containing protein [Alicyclobacillus sp.]
MIGDSRTTTNPRSRKKAVTHTRVRRPRPAVVCSAGVVVVLGGKGLSRQTWGIVPKIREIDLFLSEYPEARKVVRETHPEICFWALNGGRPLLYSKTRKVEREKGLAERLSLLQKFFPWAGEIWAEALATFRRREVSRDDILDAMAAAVTGLLGGGRLKTLPPSPESDVRGLAMEIVYFIPEM